MREIALGPAVLHGRLCPMSAPDPALDLVHQTLDALHQRGRRLHVPLDTLTRLASSKSAPVAAKNSSAIGPADARTEKAGELTVRETPQVAAAETPRATAPAAKRAVKPAAGPIAPSALAPTVGTKAERLAAMRTSVLACVQCDHLARFRQQVVFGVGNPEAELMFVGEAPGADEDTAGEPFVGKAGQLLSKIIETMGFARSDVYIANVLKCRPDMPEGTSGNRKPTLPEMNQCKPYLLEQIQIIQPRVLVGLGATAMEGLLGTDKFPITKNRGLWQEFAGIPLMPTFHPAYLLRNQALAEKRRVWEDMLAVLEKLGRPITEKQRSYFLSK